MTTTPIEYLSIEERYAAYRPVGEYTFEQAVGMIDTALAYCCENALRGLLVDIRGMTGFSPPTTMERFAFATMWAETAGGQVKVSLISRPEMIDRDKIGVTMARNRGLECDAFTDEADAITWLKYACK